MAREMTTNCLVPEGQRPVGTAVVRRRSVHRALSDQSFGRTIDNAIEMTVQSSQSLGCLSRTGFLLRKSPNVRGFRRRRTAPSSTETRPAAGRR
jgi:hypothetical protein